MDDPTDDALRERYQDRLHREADAIAREGSDTTNDRKPVVLDQQSVGRLSRMDALQTQAMAQAMEGRRTARKRAIDAALARMDSGDFGWCADCGDFIGLDRLDLEPTVVRCIDCAR